MFAITTILIKIPKHVIIQFFKKKANSTQYKAMTLIKHEDSNPLWGKIHLKTGT